MPAKGRRLQGARFADPRRAEPDELRGHALLLAPEAGHRRRRQVTAEGLDGPEEGGAIRTRMDPDEAVEGRGTPGGVSFPDHRKAQVVRAPNRDLA